MHIFKFIYQICAQVCFEKSRSHHEFRQPVDRDCLFPEGMNSGNLSNLWKNEQKIFLEKRNSTVVFSHRCDVRVVY
jgi:hypothetical protein